MKRKKKNNFWVKIAVFTENIAYFWNLTLKVFCFIENSPLFWKHVNAYITLCLFAFSFIKNTKTLNVSIAKQPNLCDTVNFRKYKWDRTF